MTKVDRGTDEGRRAINADSCRIYLAGFSQGAMLTLAIALTEPGKIAGAAVSSGRLAAVVRDNHAPPEPLRGFPILVTHGIEDQPIPIRPAHDIRKALKPMGVAVDYDEFEGGHTSATSTSTCWIGG